jgi:hypothetical protein
MEIINSWKSTAKQWGKANIKIRIGKITLFDLYLDKEKKRWGLTLLNFGLKNNTQRNGKVSIPGHTL